MGKVPALVDEGFAVVEHATILRYLCNSKGLTDGWYPTDPKRRSKVDFFYDWFAQNTNVLMSMFKAIIGKGSNLGDATTCMDKYIGDLDEYFLKNTKFVASNDRITIADLSLVFQLESLQCGYDTRKCNRVKQYLDDVKETCPELKKHVEQFLKDREGMIKEMKNESTSSTKISSSEEKIKSEKEKDLMKNRGEQIKSCETGSSETDKQKC